MTWSSSIRRWGASAVAAALLGGLYLSGSLTGLENRLAIPRFQLIRTAPTDQIVLVAIDPRSLRDMPVWPWPRQAHAAVIDAIARAGASQIAINIDFSAASTAEADRILADAIARAGDRVVLPVFEQPSLNATNRMVATAPMRSLVQHARVASVNLTPDPDGVVRRVTRFANWSGALVPSLPVSLAGFRQVSTESFQIDFGIRDDQFTTISFADVLGGKYDPAMFQGKIVFIGATALEITNALATPLDAAMPGLVLQALATESLLQGRELRSVPRWIVLTIALVLLLGLDHLVDGRPLRRGVAIAGCILIAVIAAPLVLHAATRQMLDTAPMLLAIGLALLVNLLGRLRELDLRVLSQSLLLNRTNSVMRRVVEISPDGLIIVNPGGTIQSVNSAAERILGKPADQLVSRSLESALGGDLPPSSGADPAAGDAAVERQFIAGTGEPLTVQITLTSVPGEPDGTLVAILRDVTDIRRREAQMRHARDLAETASRSKTQFLANMSHELRTPLNAIIGFSEVMRGEILGPLGTPSYRDYSGGIHDSAKHLLAIINDILDISSIEIGNQRLAEEWVQPPDVCRSVFALLADKARGAGIALELDCKPAVPRILTDRRMLMQMLINLIANAIKFSPRKGQVTLEVIAQPDGRVRFSVIDKGIGIAAADLERVKLPFEQVEGALTRRHDGVGLGLSLVKSMIDLHNGVFELESALGMGTRASLIFPAERCDRAPEPSAPEHRAQDASGNGADHAAPQQPTHSVTAAIRPRAAPGGPEEPLQPQTIDSPSDHRASLAARRSS